VLGAIPNDTSVTCYTLGDFRNNEVDVAASLAAQVGADHEFLQRDPDYYEQCLERAVRVGGGMYTFDHGHFFALDGIDAGPEPLFHGHGLDYLFQGMYLPTDRLEVAGHPTFFERLRDLPDDVAPAYRDNVSYRLTDETLERVIPDEDRPAVERELAESLRTVLSTAPEPMPEVYDRWEYLHTVNQARHYTHLNVLSIPTRLSQRTVAFDTDLFELFWSIPANKRTGGAIMKRAIGTLDERLLSVRNANTNLPAGHSPLELTTRAAWHALTRRVPVLPVTHEHPGPEGRSWPQRDAIIRERPRLRARAESLSSSRLLGSLDVFDLSAVETAVADHLAGRADIGAGILTLITIDEFLDQGGLP